MRESVYAATFPLNGFGEMTARSVVDEWGLLNSPIMLTGTNSVGIVYYWTLQYLFEHGAKQAGITSLIAMVAECDDSTLDGSQGLAISREEVYAALENATGGPVAEGCVGGGTGMHLFGFKGGIGTSSREVAVAEMQYTVGALVMTNFGDRRELRIDGVPVGRLLGEEKPETAAEGSCIVVLATDAPLHPQQCKRLAKRAALVCWLLGPSVQRKEPVRHERSRQRSVLCCLLLCFRTDNLSSQHRCQASLAAFAVPVNDC